MGTTIQAPSIPGSKTRQYKTLRRLQSNAKRNSWTTSVSGVSRLQFLDDISRLRARGWNIESNRGRNGINRYRIVN